MGLCVVSWEYNCILFHSPLRSGCKLANFGHTREEGYKGVNKIKLGNSSYLEVLESASVASWDTSMSRSRKWGVFAFSAGCPLAVIACRQDTVALAAHE